MDKTLENGKLNSRCHRRPAGNDAEEATPKNVVNNDRGDKGEQRRRRIHPELQ